MFKFDKRDAEASALRTPLERLPTEMGEANHLAYEEQIRSRNTDAIEYGLGQEYAKTLDDIEKRTGKRLINPANHFGMSDSKDHGKAMHDYEVSRINEFIARNQTEFPDLKPIDPDATLQTVISKAKAARQEWALAREYAGTGATIAGYIGGMGGSAMDPPNVAINVASFFAPPARALLPLVVREGLINAGAEALIEPGKRDVATVLGDKRTLKDMAVDVGTAGLFGVGFAGTIHGVSQGFSYLRGLRSSPDPQARAAGIAGERAAEAIHEDNPSAYVAKTAAAESGGNVTAKSTSSSATGKFQFLDDTWNDLAAETGVPRIIEGQPDPRLNEGFQNAQMEAYTKRSTNALTEAGFEVNDTNLYVTHFLGQKGGIDFLNGLKTNPDAPASSFVSADAVAANKSVFFKGGKPKTAQEFYQWANKKMGNAPPSGLPEQHIQNYDNAMTEMAEGNAAPEPGTIPGKARPPHVEGLEQIDPHSLQVDAKTFQFKEGGNDLGVTDRLAGVEKWEPDFAGIALVYEKADGSRFIADGHQRLALAKRTGAASINARVIREVDGYTPEMMRGHAGLKNIVEGTGSPLDAAKVFRTLRTRDLPGVPPTSALVRQGLALNNLGDEAFQMAVNKVIPENYAAIVGKLLKDPKLQEAAIKVLNKTNPENAIQAEAIVRQVGDTELTTTTQSSLFGDEVISESLFLERAKVMDNSLKSLKKDKSVFATLVNQADKIEGAGNRLSRDTNLERMSQDAKVTDLIQKLASRKGPVSDALSAAARSLKEGGRPGDATRSFLQSVRRAVDEGTDGSGAGRNSGSLDANQRPLEPAEIKASQELFEKQPEDFFDQLIDKEVDDAMADGRISADATMHVQDASGNMVKRKISDILEDLKADKTLVAELTDCVGGTKE